MELPPKIEAEMVGVAAEKEVITDPELKVENGGDRVEKIGEGKAARAGTFDLFHTVIGIEEIPCEV